MAKMEQRLQFLRRKGKAGVKTVAQPASSMARFDPKVE